MTTILFYSLSAFIGLIAGFLGGLLGIGGGIVIVPALILLFDLWGLFPEDLVAQIAVATSLACIIFTSAGAAIEQARRNMVDWKTVKNFFLFVILGGISSGFIASQLSSNIFRFLIGLFLLGVSTIMLTQWNPRPLKSIPSAIEKSVVGLFAGLISGLAGIGGGNIIVPVLTYYNHEIHRAIATSSALGLPIASAGTIGYYVAAEFSLLTPSNSGLVGYVYLPSFIAIAITTFIAAPFGVRFAHRTNPYILRRIFAILLILISARLLANSLS